MSDALACIDEIVDWQIDGTPVILLDFDGTLAPIVDRPEEARISESMRQVVERLAEHHPVAVISGRELADVEKRVGLANIAYSGSHGFEIQKPAHSSVTFDRADEFLDLVGRAESRLEAQIGDEQGVQLERKRYGMAVHYRRADEESTAETKSAVDEVLSEFDGLTATRGKNVFDVRPDVEWDKGDAVEWLLENLYAPDARPIFLGDDTTDEDAFEALRDEGVGIKVGDDGAETAARYRLRNPSVVETFLERLAERLE
jgi:alpha,alpha-trehalase